MNYFRVFLFYLPLFAGAQDTLIFRNNSKLIVNILHTTMDEVVYTKIRKEDRSFVIPLSRLKAIAFRDSTIQTISAAEEGEKQVSSQSGEYSRFIDTTESVTRKPDVGMYRRGTRDAQLYYTFDEFVTNRRISPHLFVMAGLHGSLLLSSSKEVDIEFPDQSLFKYADYRKGYMDKVKKLKWKYRMIVSGSFVTPVLLLVAFNKFA